MEITDIAKKFFKSIEENRYSSKPSVELPEEYQEIKGDYSDLSIFVYLTLDMIVQSTKVAESHYNDNEQLNFSEIVVKALESRGSNMKYLVKVVLDYLHNRGDEKALEQSFNSVLEVEYYAMEGTAPLLKPRSEDDPYMGQWLEDLASLRKYNRGFVTLAIEHNNIEACAAVLKKAVLPNQRKFILDIITDVLAEYLTTTDTNVQGESTLAKGVRDLKLGKVDTLEARFDDLSRSLSRTVLGEFEQLLNLLHNSEEIEEEWIICKLVN